MVAVVLQKRHAVRLTKVEVKLVFAVIMMVVVMERAPFRLSVCSIDVIVAVVEAD